MQAPQLRLIPQAVTVPQSAPKAAQLSPAQRQRLSAQLPLPGQMPQLKVPPQPSGSTPHSAPAVVHEVATQPHRPGAPPPPHDAGAAQTPHVSVPPQPSETSAQSAPWLAQVCAAHGLAPHLLAPAPPHTSPAAQAPQLMMPPHPSGAVPQVAPRAVHVVATQPASVTGAPEGPYG